jgi:uncharacterized protein YuzE
MRLGLPLTGAPRARAKSATSLNYGYDAHEDSMHVTFGKGGEGIEEELGHGLILRLGNSGKIIGLTIKDYSKRV